MAVYLPLRPNGKLPGVAGWAELEYRGVAPVGRVGRRCDELVVIDCDSRVAYEAWKQRNPNALKTYTVTTPRGFHLYYRWSPGAPTGPAVGVLPNIDIRAGSGSYVVCPPTPGYTADKCGLLPFDPSWLPTKERKRSAAGEEWATIPHGRRNSTLTSYAGMFRSTGMSAETIGKALAAVNELCCDPPLDVFELGAIAKSVGRYKPKSPEIVPAGDIDWPSWWEDQ